VSEGIASIPVQLLFCSHSIRTVELIELETARRLHFTYDLSHDEIDKLKILHRPIRVSNASGLLWETAQRSVSSLSLYLPKTTTCDFRDIPWWTGLSDSELPNLPTSFVNTDSTDIFGAVDQAMRDFCSNLNCLSTFCPTHRNPLSIPEDVRLLTLLSFRRGTLRKCVWTC
jgi:hypothetical protein